MTPRPLEGLRVLDLSRLLPGPFLTQLLYDLGAQVVKVEAPGLGDETRWIPPDVEGVGYPFAAVNRGKLSIVLDLKTPGGVEAIKRLATRSDVLLESFRPGVMDRLGLSDATLEALNPRLVRCSLVGYPPGEYRDDVGHDLNYQSLAGILALGAPSAPPTQVADLGGALYGAAGILAALLARERTGRGARVEVALADAALAFNALPLARARVAGASDEPGWELTGTIPCYRLYGCADGRHVALAALEQKFWLRFAEATGIDESLQYDRSPEAHAQVEALFATRSATEWVAALRKAGVPITPVLAPEEVRAPASPASPLTRAAGAGRAPALGEHTGAVLRDAGFSPEEIRALREGGAFGRD